MPIAWNNGLATGNRQVDDQHIRLIQLFHDLREAIDRREGHEEVGRTLNALSVYVVAHFRMEEELMIQSGYPGLDAHRRAHEVMRIQAEDLVDQFNLIGLEAGALLEVMEAWLVGHLQNEDWTMVQFLNAVQP